MAFFSGSQKVLSVGQALSVPGIGFGTATLRGEACTTAVSSALQHGYRMIDTALLYGNQQEVGAALKRSGVPREEIWLTSKVGFFPAHDSSLWMYNANNVKGEEAASVDLCLQQLDVEYVDLMLIHNPTASVAEYNAACLPHFFELESGGAFHPRHYADGEPIRPVLQQHKLQAVRMQQQADASAAAAAYDLRRRSWRAMEAALRAGKCRSIGVSNYPAALLREMQQYAQVMPAFNQLEMHPRFASPELVLVARELGVQLIGYGIGSALEIEQHEAVTAIAQRAGCTAVQVVMQWLRQRGVIPLVRSGSDAHIAENIAPFRSCSSINITINNNSGSNGSNGSNGSDYAAAAATGVQLTEAETDSLDALNRDYPYYWEPAATRLTLRP